MMRRNCFAITAAFVATIAVAGMTPAWAAMPAVDLALVLAVDVSRSMDADEQVLQRSGYVSALRHPDVIEAISSGMTGRIALTYVEWAGPYFQSIVVPWTVIGGAADAEGFAARLTIAPISREFGTSISGGLTFAARQFDGSGVDSPRRVIDVSGDGPNNMGEPVVPAREAVVARDITINGLPIVLKPGSSVTPYGIPNLDVYYEDCVIGGPGAFMITVDSPQRFDVAIRRKLVQEIAGAQPMPIPVVETVRPPPRIDCMIGEKARTPWNGR